VIRRAVYVLACVLATLAIAGPAYAHGGPIKLDVHGDGGQGVNATVSYVNDGHPVTGQVDLSFIAVAGDDGRTVGPVKMVASAEGQSFYVSSQPLPAGQWSVTVTATQPSAAKQTINVTAAALAKPAPAPVSSGGSGLVVIVLAVVVLVLLGGVFLLWRRRFRIAS
jgi:hypothetical protein